MIEEGKEIFNYTTIGLFGGGSLLVFVIHLFTKINRLIKDDKKQNKKDEAESKLYEILKFQLEKNTEEIKKLGEEIHEQKVQYSEQIKILETAIEGITYSYRLSQRIASQMLLQLTNGCNGKICPNYKTYKNYLEEIIGFSFNKINKEKEK